MPLLNLQFRLTPSIYDHEQLYASFGNRRRHIPMTMKDIVLVKDEFTIRSMENIQNMLLTSSREFGQLSREEIRNMAGTQRTSQLEETVTIDIEGEPSELCIFNSIIHRLQYIHDDIQR